jgi:biopolymer transport protein TolR
MAAEWDGAMGNGRGRSGRSRRRRAPMSQINVTPFVDVMLVLLVVFMITAPLLTVGVPVDLPKTAASRMVGQDEPLVITVQADGKVYIQDTEIELARLIPRLSAITENKKDTRIFVRGDKAVPYGRVMQVMSSISTAGFPKVALVAEDGSD